MVCVGTNSCSSMEMGRKLILYHLFKQKVSAVSSHFELQSLESLNMKTY